MKKILIISLLAAGCAAAKPATEVIKPEPPVHIVKPSGPSAGGGSPQSGSVITQKDIEEACQNVYYDFDSDVMQPKYKWSVDRCADMILRSGVAIEIFGHADERGSAEYNIALGESRARGVKQYMADRGVQRKLMAVTSLGEEYPVCTSHNELCWQLNRRVEINVSE